MESKISERTILWGSTNSYSLGHSWILRPVYIRESQLEFLSNQVALHEQPSE